MAGVRDSGNARRPRHPCRSRVQARRVRGFPPSHKDDMSGWIQSKCETPNEMHEFHLCQDYTSSNVFICPMCVFFFKKKKKDKKRKGRKEKPLLRQAKTVLHDRPRCIYSTNSARPSPRITKARIQARQLIAPTIRGYYCHIQDAALSNDPTVLTRYHIGYQMFVMMSSRFHSWSISNF